MTVYVVAVSHFRTVCPGFAAVADSVIEGLLAQAVRSHTRAQFIDGPAAANALVFDDAMSFWAAHMLRTQPGYDTSSTTASGTFSGAITSVKTGDESLGYGGVSGMSVLGGFTDGFFMTTPEGQRYLAIVNSRAATSPDWAGIGGGSVAFL